MKFLVSIVVGFIAHWSLYDVCQTLPMPDMCAHAGGVLVVYPIYKWRQGEDEAFLLSFLGVGVGVFLARVMRGMK